jgi:hypothetical protein
LTPDPIDAVNNDTDDIGGKELRVLDKNQPCSLKYLSTTVSDVSFLCCLPQCFLDLVFDVIR